MDQSEAIATAESALRSIVRDLLGDRWEALIAQKDVAEAKKRRSMETRKRPEAVATDDLLSYVDMDSLLKLIIAEWNTFRPVFKDDKRTTVAFDALNSYRRRVAHSRPLLTFERDLLCGICGQIRNQVSRYQQSQTPEPNFYAQIESAVDNEGNLGTRGTPMATPTIGIVRVGETRTFTASAVDPRDRDMQWDLHLSPYDVMAAEVYETFKNPVHGSSVTLEWTPAPEDFQPIISVFIMVRNSSGYYRESIADDWRLFRYHFEPPH